ncbi:hypothetical protein [Paenibacillus senegalensis]|uniref:hypothetical protein n=1 Tax=Paenibacillus senegalensis TaxID=1465766 RepID=UPI000289CB8D|nr:hypothetical protein [Paenibacillus senegalensis]
MPIIKNNEYTQLEFGHGDIDVAPALLKQDDIVGAVCFFNRTTANKIGEHVDYEPNLEVDLKDTPVRMTFEKVESIDVVIKMLKETKRMMIEKSLEIGVEG